MRDKVSIIIPVYNAEKYLHRCVQSILNQSYLNWEAIFVDDGSTDGSKAILQFYVEKDSRIRIISQRNAGPAAARNVGIESISGEYFLFVDADDYIDVEFINKTLTAAINNQCDMVLTSILCNGSDAGMYFCGLEKFKPLYFRVINPGPVAKLYKKSIVQRYKIRFPEDMKIAEDYVFTFLYATRVETLYAIQEPLYYYCFESEESLIHRFKRKELSYEQYQRNVEAPWRVYCSLLTDSGDISSSFISECAAELYSEFCRLYYEIKQYLTVENRRKLKAFYKLKRKDFSLHVNAFRRIFTWQRYPLLYKGVKHVRKWLTQR